MGMVTSTNPHNRFGLETLLHRITSRILQSLELEDILRATVLEVQLFLNTDRVMIYKFHPDNSGQVVAEALQENRLPSLLGLNFPADDIPPHARELLTKARVRSVVDIKSQTIGQSFLHDPETGKIVPDYIQYRAVDPCHIEYLTTMGVQSSLVIPILQNDQLWGLLVSHHSEALSMDISQLQAVQMVVDQLAVAIAQSTLLAHTREKAKCEEQVNTIAQLLRSRTTINLQKALEETVKALTGIGGRLYIQPTAFELQNNAIGHLVKFQENNAESVRIYTYGIQPIMTEQTIIKHLEQSIVWRQYFKSGEHNVWSINDLYQIPNLETLQPAFIPTNIRSILILPLNYGDRNLGYLTIFRPEIETETLWAGEFEIDQRQVRVRRSFAAWKESKKGQTKAWTSSEIELAQRVANHFAAAILHYEIHWNLQALNTQLENQVQERTAKLQQSAQQQQALLEVVTKIRASLTPDEIFQTTTQEVCKLLNVERVTVYRFNPDWGGVFIHDFECTTAEWRGIFRLGENLVWDDTYLQITKGGRYRNNETFAVDDIKIAGLYHCHLDILEQFKIKSFAIAPIFVGPNLWGLLGAYQHSSTHSWETVEVQFLAQSAAQLGMALQQADLLLQTRQQNEKISLTLEELRKTQSQLIQTEKISSLGQLVAGIAHEINNPVNFIYGNLSHAREYTEDLLSLLKLYQQSGYNFDSAISDREAEIDVEFIAEDLPKLLTSMKIGADRIRQIILSLLNFSRLDQSDMKQVDIHEGIESTLVILHHRLKAQPEKPSIEIIKQYGNLPLIECYAGQLNQVFMNILSNAIDAIEYNRHEALPPRHGQITIRTEMLEKTNDKLSLTSTKFTPSYPMVVISIADNGCGIPEDVKNSIFDPFFTTKPVGKGTGLGLSISYEIVVNKHGGNFKCKSVLGEGTEFLIEIPIKQNKLQGWDRDSSTEL